MAHKPILFSTPMVQALLEGRKTQTRRVIKGVRKDNSLLVEKPTKTRMGISTHVIDAPELGLLQYSKGDLLWVRETWAQIEEVECGCSEFCLCPQVGEVRYRATVGDDERKWKPSIFMPRQHSRLTLEVTSVRVGPLRIISEEDAKAEGVNAIGAEDGRDPDKRSFVWSFQILWDSLNKNRGYGWDTNPWVCIPEFKVHHCNIDSFNQQERS
ncbi:hypothetical protein [Pseudovibrio sp. Tun.PSC04-5.I4]|uniref:hypothetical protein n=1 Tax=Pseudovibrio sp. Tun.PSC04-5.I4 TaxID=1798213 RepID=UPI00088C1668|nr:hypothetical protein [Pseudovibrio sp. Tun.PSC04-5.I4]SDQ98904.1 hypothetical protein SAMN04515695_2197 [Pseudovibrio sp. Tun.PSC04-5.I4]